MSRVPHPDPAIARAASANRELLHEVIGYLAIAVIVISSWAWTMAPIAPVLAGAAS